MVDSTRTAAAVAAAALLLTACSSGTASTPSATPTAKACPTASPAGPPQGRQGGPGNLAAAKTIKPADMANSEALDPSGPQIQCGKTALTSHNDVVYATGLKMDIQAPATAGAKPA